MGLLENIFNISEYIDIKVDIKSKEFLRDPWMMDYIPDLYVPPEGIHEKIARLIDVVSEGNTISAILGDFKSGKSFLINILREGIEEELWKYGERYKKIFVLYFSPNIFEHYSLTNYMKKISEDVLGKHYTSKEQIIVELKNYVETTNSLIVVFIDNFNENIQKIVVDSTKLLKLLKRHLSVVISCKPNQLNGCFEAINEGGYNNFSYYFRIPELSLNDAFTIIKKRLSYAMNITNFDVAKFISKQAVETAWIFSNGNPWVLISILADAHSYIQNQNTKVIDQKEIMTVNQMFSRSSNTAGREDYDKFIIQQALNNFPNRERQVAEFLLHGDATAKEITQYLYGELSTGEYRSKYMGTKSFLKRLRDKNVVVVKGKKGRAHLFGLNAKMKEKLLNQLSKDVENVNLEGEKIPQ